MFRIPLAVQLAMSDGEEMRMPYPSQAALEATIIDHMTALTPWLWPSLRTRRACGHAWTTPRTAAMKPKTSATNTSRR